MQNTALQKGVAESMKIHSFTYPFLLIKNINKLKETIQSIINRVLCRVNIISMCVYLLQWLSGGIQSRLQTPTPILLRGTACLPHPILNRELPYVKGIHWQSRNKSPDGLTASVYKSSRTAGRKYTLQVEAPWRLMNTCTLPQGCPFHWFYSMPHMNMQNFLLAS